MNDENFEQIDLAEFDDEFTSTEVAESEFGDVPDGIYQVSVDKIQLTKSKAGTPMLKWQFRILGPTCRKRKLFKNSVITPSSLAYLKKDLTMAGLHLEKLSDLEDRLGELLDVQLEIKKVKKGEYDNIWINKQIEVDDPDAPGATSSDLPF